MRSFRLFLIVIACVMGLSSAYGQGDASAEDCADKIDKLLLSARLKLGCKYEWAADGPQKYDCSGFVKYAFEQVGIVLSRTTSTQCKEGERVFLTNIKKGDIVFFMARRESGSEIDISHVGIALSDYEDGDFKFIHASSAKKCVCISRYTDANFRNTYGGARRIISCE